MRSYEFRSVLLIPQAHLGRAKAHTEGVSGSGWEQGLDIYIFTCTCVYMFNFLRVIGVCIIYIL